MVSLGPTNTEPKGAPKPLDKHKDTVSIDSTNRAGGKFCATAALRSLAPSM